MKKSIFLIILVFVAAAFAAGGDGHAEVESLKWAPSLDPIYGDESIMNGILNYGKEGTLKLGMWFTELQSKWFSIGFMVVLFAIPLVFFLHFLIIGQKVFSHDGKKYYAFSVFQRAIHTVAGATFIVLVPTGFIMAFADFFGGGTFVAVCQELHVIATVPFAIVVIPMTLMWIKDMFPVMDDLRWMMILGGYLSKVKKPVPAGKFNAGQKMWFWVCSFGGILMILSGAILYFQDVGFGIASALEMSQIEFLRLNAIIHNILGMAVAALFFTHVYMAAVAIKGAIHSIITGYKEEEELQILHSSFYKKLKERNEI